MPHAGAGALERRPEIARKSIFTDKDGRKLFAAADRRIPFRESLERARRIQAMKFSRKKTWDI